jgi:hypothetical protein
LWISLHFSRFLLHFTFHSSLFTALSFLGNIWQDYSRFLVASTWRTGSISFIVAEHFLNLRHRTEVTKALEARNVKCFIPVLGLHPA